ncbi:MAG: dihydrolipoyl dehydrogenase [Candidatus Aminicenantes bacterium]|nr:dihydrolipoyl dehydrogenase [Candidatus Aminicenantes bacterium]
MKYDLIVIGGGPGGYVAAIRSAQLGKQVVVVEEDTLGGVCMNRGCIPTKYLLNQTKKYKDIKDNKNFVGPVDQIGYDWDQVLAGKQKIVARLIKGTEFLLQNNGVKVIQGKALPLPDHKIQVIQEDKKLLLEAENIILATGSRPAELQFLKINGKDILSSRDALELKKIPESMVIIGAGATGLEMGVIFQRMGTNVIVLELMAGILPGCDVEMVTRLERLLNRQGMKIHTMMSVEKVDKIKGSVRLTGRSLKDNKPFEFKSEKVLLAVGRKPNSEVFQNVDDRIIFDQNGFIQVNARLETGLPGVYAIGDVIGGKLLAHKASNEGIISAENAAGLDHNMRYHALPSAVFTDPEFASVGMTQEEAEDSGLDVRIGKFLLQANGRALTIGKPDGMVKIIADKEGKVVGAHILAPDAGDLITEMTLAVEKGLTLDSLSSCIHIHPTLSEAVMEACLNADNRAIHMINK